MRRATIREGIENWPGLTYGNGIYALGFGLGFYVMLLFI